MHEHMWGIVYQAGILFSYKMLETLSQTHLVIYKTPFFAFST